MERREFLHYSTLAFGSVLLGGVRLYAEDEENEAIELPFEEAYAEATKGAKKIIKNAKEMNLDIPNAPENGLVVPVEVEIDYPMQKDRYIKEIVVMPTKNKVNLALTAHYTPANGKAYLATNVKLGGTQEVVVVARTNDDVIFEKRKKVKVALGGCG